VGSLLPGSQFRDPAFRYLWAAAILFLGCQRLTFAFAADKGTCCNLQSPWFSNVLCHCVEVCLWYGLSCSKSRRPPLQVAVRAATLQGKEDERGSDFILLVALPVLTAWFYAMGAGFLG